MQKLVVFLGLVICLAMLINTCLPLTPVDFDTLSSADHGWRCGEWGENYAAQIRVLYRYDKNTTDYSNPHTGSTRPVSAGTNSTVYLSPSLEMVIEEYFNGDVYINSIRLNGQELASQINLNKDEFRNKIEMKFDKENCLTYLYLKEPLNIPLAEPAKGVLELLAPLEIRR